MVEFVSGCRVRLVPENRDTAVYKVEWLGDRFAIGLIFEDTKQAQEFVFTENEIPQRLIRLLTLKESFMQGQDLPPREQMLAFVDALRMRLAYTFDPHYAVSATQVDLLPPSAARPRYRAVWSARLEIKAPAA